MKVVPKSKLSEWKGLDRISTLVHAMRCIWREQEKDDIGIDGEIELCRPRTDGDGMIGTGKIMKVQSKSGSRYVVKDHDGSFASPVEERDLKYWAELNVPAIYVVYHPDDDKLYWKHVQGYIKSQPNVLSAPFRIEFHKGMDVFDEEAFPALEQLCELAPERVSTTRGESLFSNILPVLRLPSEVFVTPVLPEKRRNFHDRISGGDWIPPYSYAGGQVVTLIDLQGTTSALADVIDEAAGERFDLEDWLGLSDENEVRLRALLNSTLHRHLRSIGLWFSREHHRYFYNKGLAVDAPISRSWISSRTKRRQDRLVAKYYEYGKAKFYRHLALNARFDRFGERWGVVIEPKVFFSVDGEQRWEGKVARSYAIKARAEEWNNIFLNNVLFWAYQLSKGEEEFNLATDGTRLMTIIGRPAYADTTFSIEAIEPPDRRVTGSR